MHSGGSAQIELTAIVAIGPRPINEITISSWAPQLVNLDLEIIFVLDNFINEKLQSEISELYSYSGINHKIIHVDVQSPGKSREAGMSLAKGNWLVFWDCDDYPQNIDLAIDRCKKSADNTNFLIFQFIARNLFHKHPKKRTDNSVNHSLAPWTKNPGMWRVFFRRSRVADLKFENMRMGEDQVFLVKCNIDDSEVSFIDEVAYEYIVGNSGQLTNSKSRKDESRLALLSVERHLNSNHGERYRYQKQIQLNLTKTETKAEFLRREGVLQRIGFVLGSQQIRRLATLYLAEKFWKGK